MIETVQQIDQRQTAVGHWKLSGIATQITFPAITSRARLQAEHVAEKMTGQSGVAGSRSQVEGMPSVYAGKRRNQLGLLHGHQPCRSGAAEPVER